MRKMSLAAQIAAVGLCSFIVHLILCIVIHNLVSSFYLEQSLLEKTINKELIKLEITRFHHDFFSGSAITPSINATCLKAKDEQGAFEHCKKEIHWRLMYSIDSTSFDSAFTGKCSVKEFCTSMEKHRQCMQLQAKFLCCDKKQSSLSIDLPLGSPCRNPLLARLRYTDTWMIIGLDLPLILLFSIVFSVSLCWPIGEVENNTGDEQLQNVQVPLENTGRSNAEHNREAPVNPV